MKYFFFFIFTITAFVSCNRLKGPEKPENLISKDKMINILIDSKIIATSNGEQKKILRDSGVNFNTFVYEKHGVDSLQFALSNTYYTYHIDDYEEIYTRVIDSVERLATYIKEQEAEEWKAQTKKEEDSLKLVQKKDSLSEKTPAILKDSIIKDTLKPKLILPVSDSLRQLK